MVERGKLCAHTKEAALEKNKVALNQIEIRHGFGTIMNGGDVQLCRWPQSISYGPRSGPHFMAHPSSQNMLSKQVLYSARPLFAKMIDTDL
jgi:hypothetical protein